MKSLLLFSLLSLISQSLPAQSPDGFLGVSFGASEARAREIMAQKNGCTLDEEHKVPGYLSYMNASFAGHKTLYVSFMFVYDKFFRGTAYFDPDPRLPVLSQYRQIKTEFIQLYATPSSVSEVYDEQGIKSGQVIFSCNWLFPNHTDPDPLACQVVSLSIAEEMVVKLTCTDGKILKWANLEKKRRANNLREY